MPQLENPSHEAFAQTYALSGNSRKAAVECGYAAAYAYSLTSHPDISARVNEIVKQRFAKAGISAERTLIEIARIAFHDPRELFDDEYGTLRKMHELGDDVAAAVSRVEVEGRSEGHGKDKEVFTVKKIRTHDKMAALSLLARHFKIVGEDSDGVNALANALADRLKTARVRQAAVNRAELNQQAEDAVVLPHPATAAGGQRLEYGVDDDPSLAGDVTAAPLGLDVPEADSIALHSRQRAVALPTPTRAPRSTPAASEDDDEDLAG